MKAESTGDQKGFALIELLIALVVLTLGISAVIFLSFGNQDLKLDSQTNNEALTKAETMLEQARALSRQDLSLVNSIPAVQDGIYSKTLNVQVQDAYTKKVTSTVTWNPSGARPQTITLTTVVTSWQSVNKCSPTLSGDWTKPKLLGSVDVGQNNGGTDVDIFNKNAYVTADATSANKPDFYVVDVSNPNISTLPILGSVNTGPGLAAVHVAGQYAYVANESSAVSSGQLQVIDISNSANPNRVATLRLNNIVATGSQGLGHSIFYVNKKVYLGITKPASGPDFHVIDVSNPLIPVYLGGFTIGTSINAIYVKNNTAYVATPAPQGSSAKEQLTLLDVTNPSAISRISTFSAPDTSILNGNSLYLSGSTVYLGRSEETNNNGHYPDLFILNAANPTTLQQIASKYIGSGINAITVRSNLAFMLTSDTNLGFQIWDLNNLGNATPYGSLNTQQTSTGGMDCDGNIVYVAQRSNKALQIIGPGP